MLLVQGSHFETAGFVQEIIIPGCDQSLFIHSFIERQLQACPVPDMAQVLSIQW